MPVYGMNNCETSTKEENLFRDSESILNDITRMIFADDRYFEQD